MENKKKEYTGMKAEKIELNSTDIIATSFNDANAQAITLFVTGSSAKE